MPIRFPRRAHDHAIPAIPIINRLRFDGALALRGLAGVLGERTQGGCGLSTTLSHLSHPCWSKSNVEAIPPPMNKIWHSVPTTGMKPGWPLEALGHDGVVLSLIGAVAPVTPVAAILQLLGS
jgi:hypothetical protein